MSPLPNLSHIHTTTKFCHSHEKRKFLHVQEKIPTTLGTNKVSHTQKKFSTIPTKFANTHKYIHDIPTKFFHVHQTKFTHAHKFPHTSWTHSYKSNTKFSQCQYSQNPNQSSSNNITTLSKFQKPPTLPKLHHDQRKNTLQECSKANIPNMINHTMPPKFQKWQYLTMKLSMKHATTFFQAKKPKKNSPWCPHDNMEHGS